MRVPTRCLALAAFLAAAACSPSLNDWSDGDGDADADADADADGGPCPATGPYCSPSGTQVLTCDPSTGRVDVLATCGVGEGCVGGACQPVVCTPGERSCVDDRTEHLCRADGSGWDDRACGEGQVCMADQGACSMPCVLRVFILLDVSGSMSSEVGSSTKWEQARQALETLFAAHAAADVEFGLGIFPSGDGDCSTSSQVVYPVPSATAANVDAFFRENSPSGNTPLLGALELHLTETAANLNDPAYANFVLLVSDGNDTCYDSRCLAECGLFNPWCLIDCENRAEEEIIGLLGDAAGRLRDERAIRTFVIGFGDGVRAEELEAIADRGGTVLGRWLPASDVSELSAAFEAVLSEMLECNPIVY